MSVGREKEKDKSGETEQKINLHITAFGQVVRGFLYRRYIWLFLFGSKYSLHYCGVIRMRNLFPALI